MNHTWPSRRLARTRPGRSTQRCPHGALTAGHVDRIDALVTAWRGQRWVDLPGGVRARRRDGKLWFTSSVTKDEGKPVGRT